MLTKSTLTAESAKRLGCVPAGEGCSLMTLREELLREMGLSGDGLEAEADVPLARFFSHMRRLGVQCIVMDIPEAREDVIEENEDLSAAGISDHSFKLRRFLALSMPKEQVDAGGLGALEETALRSVLLGAALWKMDWGTRAGEPWHCRRVFESVARRTPEAHCFVRREPLRKIPCEGRLLEIRGHLFCQQNGVTNVCAHAALRTVTDALMNGSGLSYRSIRKTIDETRDRRASEYADTGFTAPGGDPKYDEVCEVIAAAGWVAKPHFYYENIAGEKPDSFPWQDHAYACAESGYPALVNFGPNKPESLHIIPVFGHTMNRDVWTTRAGSLGAPSFLLGSHSGFLQSHLWLSAFVIHDDLLGQNYCLPRYYLPALYHPAGGAPPPGGRITSPEYGVAVVISIRPEAAACDGVDVQVGALRMLHQLLRELEAAEPWGRRVLRALNNKTVILRTLLISGEEYMEHLRGLRDWRPGGGPGATEAELHTARDLTAGEAFLWIVEFSIPELFPANLRKVGELVLRADFAPRNKGGENERAFQCCGPNDALCGLLLARLPGFFAVPGGMGEAMDATKPDQKAAIFDCDRYPCTLSSHTELFTCKAEPESPPP